MRRLRDKKLPPFLFLLLFPFPLLPSLTRELFSSGRSPWAVGGVWSKCQEGCCCKGNAACAVSLPPVTKVCSGVRGVPAGRSAAPRCPARGSRGGAGGGGRGPPGRPSLPCPHQRPQLLERRLQL